LKSEKDVNNQQMSIKRLSNRTALSFATGVILPIQQLTDLCHQYGVIVAIDGAHAVGQTAIKYESFFSWHPSFIAFCIIRFNEKRLCFVWSYSASRI
jgi:selenocysteine lyase/cysteine desulfurase